MKCGFCGAEYEEGKQTQHSKQCPNYKSSSLPTDNLFDALMIIDDGIEAVDFILNYGRGTKSRALRTWLTKAEKFITSNATIARSKQFMDKEQCGNVRKFKRKNAITDTERIEWLDHGASDISISVVQDAPHDGEFCIVCDFPSGCYYGKTLRDAIDSAIRSSE